MAIFYPVAISTKQRGVVLGGLSGIGFALIEGLLSFLVKTVEMELYTIGAVVVSFFPRVLIHFLLSAIVGIGIASFAKNFDRQKMNTGLNISHFRKTYLLPMLFIATVLHLAYNFSALHFGSPWGLVVIIIIVLIFGNIHPVYEIQELV